MRAIMQTPLFGLTVRNGRSLRAALVAAGSTLALASAAQAAQPPAPQDAEVEEVVVTGTLIGGIAPVGAPVISVGAQEIRQMAPSSTYDLLSRSPQVVNIGMTDSTPTGGSAPQSATLNTNFSRSLNLRALGSSATLTLFNGQRVTNNLLGNATDVETFPINMVQRIEIVADGASATYGTDAIAGVANIILRRPFDGVEASVQTGLKSKDGPDWQASILAGLTWRGGGVVLSYQRYHQEHLSANAHPDLYTDDLSPYLGAAFAPSTFTSPGNVTGLVGPAGTTALYMVPAGIGSTTPLTLSQLGPANQPRRQGIWTDAWPIPEIDRETLAFALEQNLTPWLRFKGFGAYNDRTALATHNSIVTTSTLAVPATNPYSPCAAGRSQANSQGLACPANGTISTRYSWLNEFGQTVLREGVTDALNLTGSFEVSLPRDWDMRVSAHTSYDDTYSQNTGSINATALTRVLTGVGKPADIPFLNPFCDNLAAPCNDRRTVNYVFGSSRNTQRNGLHDFNGTLDGSLFELPGGAVRAAVGAQYSIQKLRIQNYSATTAAIGVEVPTAASNGRRTVKAVFGELYFPIVGANNAMPGVQSFELTLAARHTSYSDAGKTTDPKVAFTYEPVRGLKLQGTWGTSFRAPTLRESDPLAATTLFVVNTATCAQFTGITCPSPSTAISTLNYVGGRLGAQPETAVTWSLGAEIQPPQVPGLRASASFYRVDYKNRFGILAVNQVNSGLIDPYVTYNPAFFPAKSTVTPAQFAAEQQRILTSPLYGQPAPPGNPVAVIVDGRQLNTGRLITEGLDFATSYEFDLPFGSARLGANGNYVFNYRVQQLPGGPTIDQVNKYGYQLKFRGRLEAGLERGPWNVTAFLNYSNPYEANASDIPATAGAQYTKIKAYTTVDLSMGYSTGEDNQSSLLNNIRVSVVANNLFDTDPPFFLNANATGPILYDPQVAGAFGRVVTLKLTKAW